MKLSPPAILVRSRATRLTRGLIVALISFPLLLAAAAASAQPEEAAPQEAVESAAPESDQTGAAVEREVLDLLGRVEGLTDPSVSVIGGEITLRGEAVDLSVSERAEALARGVEGVDAVNNEIDLSANVSDRVRGAADRIEARAERWLAYLPLLPVAFLMVLLAIGIAWVVGRWTWPFARVTANPFLQEILQRVTQLAVLLFGVLAALEVLDAVALVGGVLGAAGVAGIAIGFAFRELAENYIASILLSVRQPFSPRDHVLIDGAEGLVSRLTTRSTILTTFDGNVVRIPNAAVFKATIVNYSTRPERRFDFTVGVGYDVDLSQARAVAVQVLGATEGVLAEPAPFAIITALGDSSITLRVFGWVNQGMHDFARVRSLAMQRLKVEFDRLDIDMPEPIYSIKMLGQKPDSAAAAPAKPRDTGRPAVDAASEAEANSVAADATIEELAKEDETAGDGANLLSQDAERE